MAKFLTFADENGEYSYLELENAAKHYCKESVCKSLFGPQGEFATILTAFGKDRCKSRMHCLNTDDITSMLLHKEWPKGFSEVD